MCFFNQRAGVVKPALSRTFLDILEACRVVGLTVHLPAGSNGVGIFEKPVSESGVGFGISGRRRLCPKSYTIAAAVTGEGIDSTFDDGRDVTDHLSGEERIALKTVTEGEELQVAGKPDQGM